MELDLAQLLQDSDAPLLFTVLAFGFELSNSNIPALGYAGTYTFSNVFLTPGVLLS